MKVVMRAPPALRGFVDYSPRSAYVQAKGHQVGLWYRSFPLLFVDYSPRWSAYVRAKGHQISTFLGTRVNALSGSLLSVSFVSHYLAYVQAKGHR
jgi:hypothetical protein